MQLPMLLKVYLRNPLAAVVSSQATRSTTRRPHSSRTRWCPLPRRLTGPVQCRCAGRACLSLSPHRPLFPPPRCLDVRDASKNSWTRVSRNRSSAAPVAASITDFVSVLDFHLTPNVVLTVLIESIYSTTEASVLITAASQKFCPYDKLIVLVAIITIIHFVVYFLFLRLNLKKMFTILVLNTSH